MSSKCSICNKEVSMPYTCNGCKDDFCSDHRLPEKHNCPALKRGGVSGEDAIKITREKNNSKKQKMKSLKENPLPDKITKNIPNNASYLFLALILVVYILQIITINTLGTGVHNSIFVLSGDKIEYVWTWVVSVFAHDPATIYHLLGNGIVLFFFGPTLEKIIGSRSFVKLFIFSGVLAGLSQVIISILINSQSIAVLGASGAILSILGVMTVYKPDMKVYLYFMIPVPLWLITGGYVVFSIGGILAVGSGIAHIAHLIGLIIGLVYGYRSKDKFHMSNKRVLGSKYR